MSAQKKLKLNKFEHIEKEIEGKYQKKEKRKRGNMKVSGGKVRALARIIGKKIN